MNKEDGFWNRRSWPDQWSTECVKLEWISVLRRGLPVFVPTHGSLVTGPCDLDQPVLDTSTYHTSALSLKQAHATHLEGNNSLPLWPRRGCVMPYSRWRRFLLQEHRAHWSRVAAFNCSAAAVKITLAFPAHLSLGDSLIVSLHPFASHSQTLFHFLFPVFKPQWFSVDQTWRFPFIAQWGGGGGVVAFYFHTNSKCMLYLAFF